MTWLTPLTGLIVAAAVIPPLILLYFLKLRRRTQPIACTLLWKRSVEDLQANAPFQRLRRNILLLLQLLALILMILAVMQPQVQAGQGSGGKTILLIDNSASMSAIDGPGGTSRLDIAKRVARARIEAMYSGGIFAGSPGETMIIAFSERAQIYCRFTSTRQQLLDAIDAIEPTHGETRIAEALQLARAYTTNVVDVMGEARPTGEPANIELFSDGHIDDLSEQVRRAGESFIYHAIGTADADNVAIAAISADRPFDRPDAIEVFASLLNFNQSEVICDVQLSVNGTARGIREISIPPARIEPQSERLIPGRNNVVFAPFEQPRDAVIEIANLREDALVADNIAQLVVPPAKHLTVALVAPKSFLLRTALDPSGMPLQRLDVLTAEEFDLLAEDGGVDRYDVIVLDNHAPQSLPPARYLSFGATPPLEGLNEFGQGENQLILATRQDHPVMQNVALDNLFVSKMQLLQPRDDVHVVAEAANGPAIVAISRGSLHVLHVTFDPLDSNWPFLRSFVNFLYNAVDHLGHIGEVLTSEGLRPGQALATRLPAEAQRIELRTPDNIVHRLMPIDPTQLTWGPIRLSGAHLLEWFEPGITGETRQSRAFAVNLLSEQEGNLATVQTIELGQDSIQGRADASRHMPLWPWAVGLCLGLLLIEWWVYQRKTFF